MRFKPLWTTLAAFVGIALVCVIAIGALHAGYHSYYMPADSMAPTLLKNDVLVTNRLAYLRGQPHDGDIVVVSPPIARSNPFIKRVVAVPGERMRITKGALYVNDVRVSE